MELVSNAGRVNLFCALAILLAGGLIYWVARPKIFTEHPFSQRAFVFWLIQWFLLIVTWATYAGQPSRQVLATIDLYVAAVLGFFWTYAEAETFQWPRTVRNLTGVYGLLLLWNLLIGTEALNRPSNSYWRWLWVLPSETMSALSLLLIAVVFLYRYGSPAIPLACVVIPVYAFLQRPIYTAMFIEPRSAGWTLALAIGKICYGLLFYTIFFLPARRYEAVEHPHFESTSPQLSRVGRWALGVAGGLILTVVGNVLTTWIGQMLKPR